MANGIAPTKLKTFDHPAYVDEFVLQVWSESCEDEQHLEIIRLAGLGLLLEQHGEAVKDALALAMGDMPIARVSRFEKAFDAIKRKA